MSETYDRYLSFKGCDWEARCARVFAGLQDHFDRCTSPFWPYFQEQRARLHSQGLDDLRVLHNYVSTLRDLLDDLGDTETLALLEDLEVTCM